MKRLALLLPFLFLLSCGSYTSLLHQRDLHLVKSQDQPKDQTVVQLENPTPTASNHSIKHTIFTVPSPLPSHDAISEKRELSEYPKNSTLRENSSFQLNNLSLHLAETETKETQLRKRSKIRQYSVAKHELKRLQKSSQSSDPLMIIAIVVTVILMIIALYVIFKICWEIFTGFLYMMDN